MLLEGMCGLAETCRSHNTKVASSSPPTANVLFTLLASLTRAIFSTLLGECYNLSADKLLRGKLHA